MKKSRNLFISVLTISSVLLPLEINKAQEKIEVIPLIKSTKGFWEVYPKGKQVELRFFKLIIPVGGKTPIHRHQVLTVVYIAQGKLKNNSGYVIN